MRLLPYVIGFLVLIAATKAFNAAENGSALSRVSFPEAGNLVPTDALLQQQDKGAAGQEAPVGTTCSDAEIQLLGSLRHRREEIEQKGKELNVDLSIMRVIDQSVDNKLQSLKKLQEELAKIVDVQEGKQSADIAGLVKIYENMKPKDVAKIFDTLQLPVLLAVAEKMKEAKLALVLAAMESGKAKALQEDLAGKRKVTDTMQAPVLPHN